MEMNNTNITIDNNESIFIINNYTDKDSGV